MKSISLFKLSAVLMLTVSMAVSSLYGAEWNWKAPYQGPKKDVVTLIITANNRNARILADLFQYRTRQPQLVLPREGDDSFYWVPRRKDGTGVRKINLRYFPRFVRFLHPEKVIILGDERYVPREYREAIDPSIPVSVYRGDWENIAYVIGRDERVNKLGEDYSRLLRKAANTYVPMQKVDPRSLQQPVRSEENTAFIDADMAPALEAADTAGDEVEASESSDVTVEAQE